MTTNSIQYCLDKKYRREDTPGCCAGASSPKRPRRPENPPKRRFILRSRESLLWSLQILFASHNRGWTGANLFETPPTNPTITDTYMLLVHCTYPTGGYEVTRPMSYRNVGFFLSPLPRTTSEPATTQTPMRSTKWEVVTLPCAKCDH